jgi:hypothetical protein
MKIIDLYLKNSQGIKGTVLGCGISIPPTNQRIISTTKQMTTLEYAPRQTKALGFMTKQP